MEKESKKIIEPEEIFSKFISKSSRDFFWTSLPGKFNDRFFSENVYKITGFTESEINLLPDKYFSLIHEEDLKVVRGKTDFLIFSDDENISLEYRIINKCGNTVWLIEEIFFDKKSKIFYGKISNITDLRLNEEAAIKREKELNELNAVKDKFISIISHDLKSPFTSILGFVDILINEKNLKESDRQEYLKYIQNSSAHLLLLINHLSDWCKIKNGRIRFDKRKTPIQHIINSSIFTLTGEAVRKNIKIQTSLKGNFSVLGDEKQLTDAITHILSNAIKFSNTDKIIEIKAGIFNNDFLEVVIKDEGIGISENNQEKLFKIDSLFSTEGTKGEKGTGLGLALVKEIINKHNGEIWFYSEKGKGTEFHITLPYLKDYLLLINNDIIQINLIENIIKNEFSFYNIIKCDNLFDAVNLIEEKLPALVIAQEDMPLVTDSDLISTIRKISRNESLPVILIKESITEKPILTESEHIFEVIPPLNKKNLIKQIKLALNL